MMSWKTQAPRRRAVYQNKKSPRQPSFLGKSFFNAKKGTTWFFMVFVQEPITPFFGKRKKERGNPLPLSSLFPRFLYDGRGIKAKSILVKGSVTLSQGGAETAETFG